MKTYLKIIIIIFLIHFITASCDKVEAPYTNPVGPPVNGRKILVEDFTGHMCPNCPRAARVIIEKLIPAFGDRVIPVALHVSGLADPIPGWLPDTFRTEAGDQIDEYFQISAGGLPKGMINRKEYNGSISIGDGDWYSAVLNLLTENPTDTITIENEYNTVTRELSTSISTTFLTNIDQELTLTVFLLEDSIVGPQLDNESGEPGDMVSDYVFMHVLRDAINGTWGESIGTSFQIGETIEKEYTYTVDTRWVAEKCIVLAYISYADTKEVLQAAEKPLQEH